MATGAPTTISINSATRNNSTRLRSDAELLAKEQLSLADRKPSRSSYGFGNIGKDITLTGTSPQTQLNVQYLDAASTSHRTTDYAKPCRSFGRHESHVRAQLPSESQSRISVDQNARTHNTKTSTTSTIQPTVYQSSPSMRSV
jgi:hypothetical protein